MVGEVGLEEESPGRHEAKEWKVRKEMEFPFYHKSSWGPFLYMFNMRDMSNDNELLEMHLK